MTYISEISLLKRFDWFVFSTADMRLIYWTHEVSYLIANKEAPKKLLENVNVENYQKWFSFLSNMFIAVYGDIGQENDNYYLHITTN